MIHHIFATNIQIIFQSFKKLVIKSNNIMIILLNCNLNCIYTQNEYNFNFYSYLIVS